MNTNEIELWNSNPEEINIEPDQRSFFLDIRESIYSKTGFVKINGKEYDTLGQVIRFVFYSILSEEGYLLIRSQTPEYDGMFKKDDFLDLFKELVKNDMLEFVAQPTIQYQGRPVRTVERIYYGIARMKAPSLSGTVRYISMLEKITNINNNPTVDDTPFTRNEILEQNDSVEIPNGKIKGLFHWAYMPLNSTNISSGIELTKILELLPDKYEGKVTHGIDHHKVLLKHDNRFDNYFKYIKEEEESFGNEVSPHYDRRIIVRSSIIFDTVSNDIFEPILVLDPPWPIYLNEPQMTEGDGKIALQLKEHLIDTIDIEYIYLLFRKPEFYNQFYQVEGQYEGFTISSNTILKAKIPELPPLNEQKKHVKKDKESFIAELRKSYKEHEYAIGIKKSDISHSIGSPLTEIKNLSRYLLNYIESDSTLLPPDTKVKSSKHDYSARDILEMIIQNVDRGELWIRGLGLEINIPLEEKNIHDLLDSKLHNFTQRRYPFKIISNISGLEDSNLMLNDNFEFIIENLLSNANRHAFKTRTENNIVDLRWRVVNYLDIKYLNLSFSNNGSEMEISLKDFIEYGKKGDKTGHTGIGGNDVYEIVKSYNGFLGQKKNTPGFSVTFDILLPLTDISQLNEIESVKYEPDEIE